MNVLSLTLTLFFVCFVTPAFAAGCNTQENITGAPNLFPVDTSDPVFVARVPNGELYTVGTVGKDFTYLLHVYGNNGYDFGYAAGQLLGPQMNATLSTAWAYFVDQIEGVINGTGHRYNIPQYWIDKIATLGLEAALDLQNDLSAPFMDNQIFAEMRGISDATGLSYDMIRRIHLIGEITRGSCSLYGAWGNATANGHVLQLRALDWDTHAGLQNNPLVTFYHPLNPSMGYPFANVGWAGWIGTLTGMSSKKIGMSEIGVSFPNYPPYFGDETFEGIPFVFLERELMQYATSVYDAMDRIEKANRTCQLMLGVADANAQTARLVQYSHSEVNFYDDTNLEPLAWWHPRIPDVVYAGMDWFCPFYQHSMANQLQLYHGKLTPEISIFNVTAAVMTGDLHAAVYDLTEGLLFVGNHAPLAANGSDVGLKAYERQWVRLNASYLFDKPFGTN
jgi:isopenicillin-N N-acyltransferase-like protein